MILAALQSDSKRFESVALRAAVLNGTAASAGRPRCNLYLVEAVRFINHNAAAGALNLEVNFD
jgi:hypothetical protein